MFAFNIIVVIYILTYFQGFVFPPGSWPVWADHNMWAPEIHFVSGPLNVNDDGRILSDENADGDD